MSDIPHPDRIEWPNNRGYTPCSAEYFNKMEQRDKIYIPDHGRTLDELTPEEYQEWSVLDDELNTMQLFGHLGHHVRY